MPPKGSKTEIALQPFKRPWVCRSYRHVGGRHPEQHVRRMARNYLGAAELSRQRVGNSSAATRRAQPVPPGPGKSKVGFARSGGSDWFPSSGCNVEPSRGLDHAAIGLLAGYNAEAGNAGILG